MNVYFLLVSTSCYYVLQCLSHYYVPTLYYSLSSSATPANTHLAAFSLVFRKKFQT